MAMSGMDEFAEFYRKLKQLRDHHKKYADDTEEPLEMEFLRLDEERKNPPEELQSQFVVVRTISAPICCWSTG